MARLLLVFCPDLKMYPFRKCFTSSLPLFPQIYAPSFQQKTKTNIVSLINSSSNSVSRWIYLFLTVKLPVFLNLFAVAWWCSRKYTKNILNIGIFSSSCQSSNLCFTTLYSVGRKAEFRAHNSSIAALCDCVDPKFIHANIFGSVTYCQDQPDYSHLPLEVYFL